MVTRARRAALAAVWQHGTTLAAMMGLKPG
jgi:hypothetical protein